MTSCPICQIDPEAHSFRRLGKTPFQLEILYTCPGKAKEKPNEKTFLTYFQHHMDDMRPSPWIWIFDCKDMTAAHLLSLSTTKEMLRILREEHSNTLQGIYIINQHWIFKNFLQLCTPFMRREDRARLAVFNGPVLETLVELERRGIPMYLLSSLRE